MGSPLRVAALLLLLPHAALASNMCCTAGVMTAGRHASTSPTNELLPDDLAQLGHPDVVMAPIDGFLTLTHEEIADVLDQLHPAIVIPMHSFSAQNTAEFLAQMHDRYRVIRHNGPSVHFTRDDIPVQPEILALRGFSFLRAFVVNSFLLSGAEGCVARLPR